MDIEVKTFIKINASPLEVWKVLVDFDSYPKWNSIIKSAVGTISIGEKIKVNVKGLRIPAQISEIEENHLLIWQGTLIHPVIFNGLHSFRLLGNSDGSTTLEHSESFSGILSSILRRKLQVDVKNDYLKMNAEC